MSKSVLITGSKGFIGKNLAVHLSECPHIEVLEFTRQDDFEQLRKQVARSDVICHLAGVNRPDQDSGFEQDNVRLTRMLCDAIEAKASPVNVVFSSSVQETQDTPYGKSKRQAEAELTARLPALGCGLFIFRLPNVFGKWARPEYNSVVATFCHRIAREQPVDVHDPSSKIGLVYIDDVVSRLMDVIHGRAGDERFVKINPQYSTTVGELATCLKSIANGRENLDVENLGSGLIRALYATYASYLPSERFSYSIPGFTDSRGVFTEVFKTRNSGQFSYFTAHPGVTRGGHYHHSKVEKFLVLYGEARFRFRNIDDGGNHELTTTGKAPRVVESIPGWIHDITNVGDSPLIVLLWANEVFNPDFPDTYTGELN